MKVNLHLLLSGLGPGPLNNAVLCAYIQVITDI